ncbi:hypothetical protein N0V85_005152 [Neurospora sp. IMI 360204]|nr:hypothetical protein N0V85_005152 [Neurospora sp. IMI 360204]
MDHLDSPPHIHGWHRNNHRSRDRRRTRRELRACPAVTRRHLDLFVALYEDTVWVNEADIEREIASDTGRDDNSTQGEQPTNKSDELWRREWPSTTTQGKASTSTSTGTGATTQPKSIISADNDMSGHLTQEQRLTAHDEIMAIMTKRLDIKTHEPGTTHSTPSTNTDTTPPTNTVTTPPTSTSAGAGTTTQPEPEATGELAQTEHNPKLLSLLDWFLTNKERIGSMDAPGGSSGVASRHGNADYL